MDAILVGLLGKLKNSIVEAFDKSLKDVTVTKTEYIKQPLTSCSHLFNNVSYWYWFDVDTHIVYRNITSDYITSILSVLDTSSSKSFQRMFSYCYGIETIPEFDTSSGKDFEAMFYECNILKTIPELDTSNGNYFSYMFYECNSLETVPELNTRYGLEFFRTFYNCYSLKNVLYLDLNKATEIKYEVDEYGDQRAYGVLYELFEGCKSLTNIYLYNIRLSLKIGSGTKWGHLLTLESLIHILNELIPDYNTVYKRIEREDNGDFISDPTGVNYTIDELYKFSNTGWYTTTGDQVYRAYVDPDAPYPIYLYKTKDFITKTLTMGSANMTKLEGVYCKITDTTNEKLPMELCESTDEGAITIDDYVIAKGWQIQ